MKERYIVLFTFLAIVSFATLLVFGVVITNAEKDETIRAEGEIVDMKQEPSGHWLGGYEFFVQLNTSIKWYEISETSYWKVEIGDYIILYESKRAEIKD